MKRLFAVCILGVVLMLTGCNVQEYINGHIEENIEKELETGAEYAQYAQMREQGQFDEDGYYIGEDIGADLGRVWVTFAENSLLKTQYYYDAKFTKPIDPTCCFLDSGDSIYAPLPEVNSDNSAYSFVGYRVWIYSADGTRLGEVPVEQKDGLIVTIPDDDEVFGLSVEPIGEYVDRTFELYDYTVMAGEQNPFVGTWQINEQYIVGDSASVSAVEEFTVKYHYDTDRYYVYSTEPHTDFVNSADGVVSFHKTAGLYDTPKYSVGLKEYVRLNIFGEEKGLSDVITAVDASGASVAVDKLRNGYIVTVKTKEAYGLFYAGDISNSLEITHNKQNDVNEFTFIVPDDMEQIDLKVRKWHKTQIVFDVPNGLLDIIGNVFDGIAGKDSDGDLLLVKTSTEDHSLEDIQIDKKISLREDDKLVICLDEKISHYPNVAFKVWVDNEPPVLLYYGCENSVIEQEYTDREMRIKIEILSGTVFDRKDINNNGLDVRYLVDGVEIPDGTFLESGKTVDVKVWSSIGYTIDSDVVDNKSGIYSGKVTVTGKTTMNDFVVNCTKN